MTPSMSIMAYFGSPSLVLLLTLSLLFGYFLSLALYRLYLSPLSKFPGPPLAAVTLWYEFYYDVMRRGTYTWKIGEMHEKYGVY